MDTQSKRKGIILSGGTGTRLHPSTIAVSKQLMPVYDKPMIYYPLCVLLDAGVREILIITTPHDKESFELLLGDGSRWGVQFTYAVQPKPRGLAEALIIGEDFLAGDPCVLILGDNLFFGEAFTAGLKEAMMQDSGATVFGYRVNDPERYGVVEFDENGRAVSIVEKPEQPRSNYAVTGLYFYDGQAPKYAKEIKPSGRYELEITSLNEIYLNRGELQVEKLSSGTTWLDTGTHASLFQAASFVNVLEQRQGIRICCPEVSSFKNGWIDRVQLLALSKPLEKSGYGRYLRQVAESG